MAPGIAFDGTVQLPAALIQNWVDHPTATAACYTKKLTPTPQINISISKTTMRLVHESSTFDLSNTGMKAPQRWPTFPENRFRVLLPLTRNYPNPFK
jgi:hypothetical protein